MIAIIDYGTSNLRSVEKALEKVGFQAIITKNPRDIDQAKGLILPGVGAFDPLMEGLEQANLIPVIKKEIKKGKPFLGICLGLQVLFPQSEEGKLPGLGILKGKVKKFSFSPKKALKVPHMGWNEIVIKKKDSPIFAGINDRAMMYFVHSYYVNPSDEAVVATTTNYEKEFTSAVISDNIFATQFHLEKSGEAGLQILKNFGELCR